MAGFDLGDLADGGIEGLKRRLSGVRKPHLDEGDVLQPQFSCVELGAIAADVSGLFEAPDPGRHRGFGQPHLLPQSDHGQPAASPKRAQDTMVNLI